MGKDLKATSLFQLIDRKFFDQLVAKWQVDKGVTRFSTWEMTCALITAALSRLSTYREVQCALGIARSTMGDALQKRSFGFFQELSEHILCQIRIQTTSRKVKKTIREILALDSTEIGVHGSLFHLPLWRPKSGPSSKAAAKLHVVWNVCGEWIEEFIITPVRKHDSPVSRLFKILPGKIYVFDRAYNDLSFWYDIQKAGSDFVTRLRNIPRQRYLELYTKSKCSARCRILLDGIYQPTAITLRNRPGLPKTLRFRHIIYRDPETDRIFHFVTSDFKSPATTIAEIYRKRWAVELLFRWLKGHLDIRYLAVRNVNAVKTQLAIAVLVQLLLQLKKITEAFEGTLWDLLRIIRTTLVRESLTPNLSPDGCRWNSRPAAEITS